MFYVEISLADSPFPVQVQENISINYVPGNKGRCLPYSHFLPLTRGQHHQHWKLLPVNKK